jgi:putative Mg2+ transporter-C (MgtC) family protein
MPLTLSLQQIALRLFLALAASFLIGYDRDEHGKTSGIRTTMLVCLAATLAMLQANLLMDTTGKTSGSFVSLDLMRIPLGILSGIGFIGAGAILRKDGLVHGLPTAATLWFITVSAFSSGAANSALPSSAP